MKINKLIEKLQDVLFDVKETTIQLYEMSQPQSEVRTTVRRLSEPIIEHILKIMLYGKDTSSTIHHWCAEICNWLDQCVKQKIKFFFIFICCPKTRYTIYCYQITKTTTIY